MAKKVGAIVSLSIIGVLIVLTIIFANVKYDYSIKCNAPDFILVESSSTSAAVVDKDGSYNGIKSTEIEKLINNASKEVFISAMFNGNLGKKANIVTESTVGKSLPTAEGYYVTYRYTKPQILKDGKKDYKDDQGTYKYRELVFSVTKTDGEATVKVYVKPYYDADGEISYENKYTKYYELSADFTELYNYLADKVR